MRTRLTAAILALSAAALTLAAGAGANTVGIYRNSLGTDAQRGQIGKLSGERCARGGSKTAFRIMLGKATRECAYRTPVVGRDLEILATERLLSATPMPVRRKAFLALNLRTGDAGAGYQLAVFPLQRKAQLRKVLSNGQVRYLRIERGLATVKGVNQANQLRLRAFNITRGPEKGNCRIRAFVGGKLVADVVDPAAGDLHGRGSGFSIGAVGNGKGLVGSVDDLVIRVPSPF
jgi:hypothetical protein